MEEVKKPKTVYETKYIASDGTEFSVKEECIKYEESLKCVLLTGLKSLIVKTTTECTIFGTGSDEDDSVIAIKLNDAEGKVKLMNYLSHEYQGYSSYASKMIEVNKRYQIGETYFIYVGWNFETFYCLGTVKEIVNRIKNRLNSILKDDEQNVEEAGK